MTSITTRKGSYTVQAERSNSKIVDESKKKTSLLKDSSWIKKSQNEDKAVDYNSNFGRSVLTRFKSTENLVSPSEEGSSTTVITSTSSIKKASSVQNLTKRFSLSQDQVDSKSVTATAIKNDTKMAVTRRTSDVKSPTKSEVFTEKVLSDVTSTSISKTQTQFSKSTEATTRRASLSKTQAVTASATRSTTVQDEVKVVKSVSSAISKETIVKDDTKAVKSVVSPTSPIKTITSPTSQAAEVKHTSYSVRSKYSVGEQLADTLTPTSIKTIQSTPDSSETSSSTLYKSYKQVRTEDYPSSSLVTKTTVSSKPESDVWSSTQTYTTTTYTESRGDNLIDTYSSRNIETVYSSADRKITDKDLCTYCHKPMLSEVKMIIDDMNIKCHASCFKCDVCHNSLGHLKAGDSMWLYRQTLHCETCFGATKSKWLR